MIAAWPGALVRRKDVQLFLTSFLGLYAELLCIRWMPAHVRYLSYFTNFILLASFLGLGVGILGDSMHEMIRRVTTEPVMALSPALTNPMLTALMGAILGMIAGGLIGWVIDSTLTRMGAGPPLPRQETLVTVRIDENRVDEVSAALFRARARHMHVAEVASV